MNRFEHVHPNVPAKSWDLGDNTENTKKYVQDFFIHSLSILDSAVDILSMKRSVTNSHHSKDSQLLVCSEFFLCCQKFKTND